MLLTNTGDDRNGRGGITGDAANIGARLKAFSGVDCIPVSKRTFQAIEGFFQTMALLPLTMKSHCKAITPYRFLGELPAATRFGVAKRRGPTIHHPSRDSQVFIVSATAPTTPGF